MKPPKIIALLAFRDEEKYLPGYFRHLERYVDGFVCVDDGSWDNSIDVIMDLKKTWNTKIRVLTRERTESPHANEVANRKVLLEKAKELGADWVLCTDADERYETEFLRQLKHLIALPRIVHVDVKDLWNSPNSYRVDGIWSRKNKPVLFPLANYTGNYCDKGELHSTWVPPEIAQSVCFHRSDYNLYHLRSIHAEDRAKRVAKFNQIDPEKKFQAIGYDYLNDETGLQLEQIPEGRGYEN